MKEKEARALVPTLMAYNRARHNAAKYKRKGHTYGYNKWRSEQRTLYKQFGFKSPKQFRDLIWTVHFYDLKREYKRKEASVYVMSSARRLKEYFKHAFSEFGKRIKKMFGVAS